MSKHSKLDREHNNVNSSYYNQEKIVKNKRLSASPEYKSSFKPITLSSDVSITKNKAYFATNETHKIDYNPRNIVKRALKRRSLNPNSPALQSILTVNIKSRSNSKVGAGLNESAISPQRIVFSQNESWRAVPITSLTIPSASKETKSSLKKFSTSGKRISKVSKGKIFIL